jgi:hypothetical protein
MGLREFISKSRPNFRAAFFWSVGSKRGGNGVPQFPLWGESPPRPEGATSRRRRIDVCGGGWGFTSRLDRGVMGSPDESRRAIPLFLIPLFL